MLPSSSVFGFLIDPERDLWGVESSRRLFVESSLRSRICCVSGFGTGKKATAFFALFSSRP